ncbi:DUF5689 domain-containing protein [Flavobacterium amniphilum]|uniref:DUF5689 domain-containing protein n=1 Tax=Flavobacterium amniphilum TaxID=1834035 RepID=UPI00202A3A6F|nr:DUF5689 domain-containing protein [Flavobacterium amniphilum]MCL9804235.1 DUF5689 domain-containing protein [Flavobacterium amniphilum]
MKTLNFKGFLLSSLLLAATVSCVEEHYDAPNLDGECETIPVTKQVVDITSTATAAYKHWTDDDVIEAYVTSSDESGNFYKSVSFVSVDGAVGFSMPIDAYNIYTYFEPGRKVFVKMKDLYYQTKDNSTVIGSLYDNDTPTVPTDDNVGRIAGVDFKNIIKASCVTVSEEDIVVKPANITAAKNNNLLNKLIELDGVQFTDASNGKKYFDATLNNLGDATNHTITDASGNTVIVRVSKFASFSGKNVNMKNGKIRGVLTKFGTDFQFMVRNEDDFKLTNTRVDFQPAIGGGSATFTGAFTENFESYAANQSNFPKYINDAFVGPRYWQIKTSAGTKCIEMTSFGSSGTSVTAKTYFFVPVDFTAANTMTFKEQMRFNQGVALQVYYVTAANYTPGGTVNTNNFINITSSFTGITYPATGASESAFNSAGTYSIPAGITGNGYFVFEYSGTPTLTTTVQIDDIVVN